MLKRRLQGRDAHRARCSWRWMAFSVALITVGLNTTGSPAWAVGPTPDLGVLGSGQGAGGAAFEQADKVVPFEFPRDHGPHPGFRQEWWYVTGNLDGPAGEAFGFELTFFRFALTPSVATPAGTGVSTAAASTRTGGGESAWRTNQVYLAHFAVTDGPRAQFQFAEKLARSALGLAGAQAMPFQVWIDDWTLGTPGAAPAPAASTSSSAALAASAVVGAPWHLHAAGRGYELTLDALPLSNPVLNGEQGLSRKSAEPGSASYYYSIPRIEVQGHLVRAGQSMPVHGLAWLDREWGSGTLGRQEQGWDWFALQLQDGTALMFYSMRNQDGSRDPNSAGTWVDTQGRAHPLSSRDVEIQVLGYWTNPDGDRYPARWNVRVPAVGLDVNVQPFVADQELRTRPRYWEGAVKVTPAEPRSGNSGLPAVTAGTTNSVPGAVNQGSGYVELVGYARASGGEGAAK